jgi:S1-C subfamily serine protease
MHASDRLTALALLALASLALSMSGAHAETIYTYNNQRYPTAAAALADFQRDLDARITAVTVSPTPLAGKALIVVPDRARLRPLILSTASAAVKADPDTPVAFRHRYLWAQANALMRARIFQKAEIAERNDTVAPVMEGYDYLIWFQVKSVRPDFTGPWTGQWLMRKSGAAAVTYRPVVDPGIPVQRQLAVFADVVRQAALKLEVGAQAGAGALGDSDTLHRADTGTGIIVSRDGLIITNNHVVLNCGDIRVQDHDGNAIIASLKAHDDHNDLALLKSSRQWTDVARFRGGAAIRAGDGVVAIGYPLAGMLGSESEASITTGTVSALSGISNDTRFLQLTAPVQPGNSGGPLLDLSGRLIGVVTAKLNAIAIAGATGDIPQNVNFALKGAVVRSFLDANSVAYSDAPAENGLSAADIGDMAKKFTVLVECRK